MITVRFKDTFRERLPEWISSLAMLCWGIIVISEPPEVWAQGYFNVLATYASQQVWGTVTILLGSLRLIALGINGAWRPTGHIRAFGALAGVLVWTSIIFGYVGLDWNPPAFATKGAMIAIDMAALWFAAGDAKLADIKAKGLYLNGSSKPKA